MNKHFEDAAYYLKRAGEHAKAGLAEELAPLERRIREFRGQEQEPELSRLEKVQAELADIERRAEGETKKAVADARKRLSEYRSKETPDEEPAAEQTTE
jgi:molecular chaperone GrpE (heat shock protein)